MTSQDCDWASMHARYLALRSIRVQNRPHACPARPETPVRGEAAEDGLFEAAALRSPKQAVEDISSAEAAALVRKSASDVRGFNRTESVGSDLTCRTSCDDMSMFCRTESVVMEHDSDLGWSASSQALPSQQLLPSRSPADGLHGLTLHISEPSSAEARAKDCIYGVELERFQSCMPAGLWPEDPPAGAREEVTPTAEREAHAAARLWSACRVFTVSARRDGGRLDCCAANAATAILRISSGSVLFTRSMPAHCIPRIAR